ncbi:MULTISPECIES: DUF4344 domain-containing metallopeptidase [unclassified Vibrio]|uniref:DUF4344 domain-containing metallopeptidase n=1 Tax=unclassified Vibrio TaxID=2614977 RepID=UPI0013613525|nr:MULTISPECIES: DUF4344 domain-containing metallopeptidase [unclassified Vibrio]NAW59983.1 hypothetical protein [Vibrio sp. V36_P2S2PM302]NAX21614.1 hypothetical protein [Vibrio sp. V39_P1S14PM300]NAX25517.1 hypothetical protein [Vibrio sp. V38_P2S17PM301]NAX32317.1 hypothetical protein [Vibrio sp. V37_P2S8PM304]
MHTAPFFLLSSLALTSTAQAGPKLIIDYLPPLKEHEQALKTDIQRSGINQIVVELSERYFRFQDPLTIVYGSSEGPLYDPQQHVIHVPYRFYQDSLDYFSNNDYEKRYGRSARQGAQDTLLHTLLHEVGHAFIAENDIPVLGKEEDAVDNFATLMMINYVSEGQDMAISAADMFAFESEFRPDYYDFGEYIDEHSFDLQRYFSTLCLVYGSDPSGYQHLLDEVENDYLQDRKDFCIYQFERVNRNWHHYLSSARSPEQK